MRGLGKLQSITFCTVRPRNVFARFQFNHPQIGDLRVQLQASVKVIGEAQAIVMKLCTALVKETCLPISAQSPKKGPSSLGYVT